MPNRRSKVWRGGGRVTLPEGRTKSRTVSGNEVNPREKPKGGGDFAFEDVIKAIKKKKEEGRK